MRTINFSEPYMMITLHKPDTKKELKQMLVALKNYAVADSNFMVYLNDMTQETIIAGIGEQHLYKIMNYLSAHTNLDLSHLQPQVLYKETIRTKVTSEGRFIRQASSLCRYGHCWIELEPSLRGTGNEFVNTIVDENVIPSDYISSVNHGIQKAKTCGILGNFPVVDVKATLYSGSFHPADSNHMSYEIAGAMAFKNGMKQADPIILEPIMNMMVELAEGHSPDKLHPLLAKWGAKKSIASKTGTSIWTAAIPLRELIPSSLDTCRGMNGNCTVTFGYYDAVPEAMKDTIVREFSLRDAYYFDLFFWSKWEKDEEEYYLDSFIDSFWEG